MNLHLAEISRNVTPGAHAVVLLDGAGWHQTGGKLQVPDNISLLHLPAYSPELNPVENIWQFLRQNQLSNRVFDRYTDIVDACCDAWNALTADPGRIRSIATLPACGERVASCAAASRVRGAFLRRRAPHPPRTFGPRHPLPVARGEGKRVCGFA